MNRILLLCVSLGCSGTHPLFATEDGGMPDAGSASDAGRVDAGIADVDGGSLDAGMPDSGLEECEVGCELERSDYLKAPGARAQSHAGAVLAISDDGDVLAVGAPNDPSGASGTSCDGVGPCADPVAEWAYRGSVQIWNRTVEGWTRGTFVKSPESFDREFFGTAVALSGDGRTLAVGTSDEAGPSAVHVYGSEDGVDWEYVASLRAAEGSAEDAFSRTLSLSSDGRVLAVGASREDSSAVGTGCDGSAGCADDSLEDSGAVYVFERDEVWTLSAYLKASNPDESDAFGTGVALSRDGEMLVVGAPGEQSTIGGTECDGGECTNDEGLAVGALYVFERGAEGWSQEAFLKPSFPLQGEAMGQFLRVAAGGDLIVCASPWVGAYSGTVYFFERVGGRWQQASVLGRAGAIGFGAGLGISEAGGLMAIGKGSFDASVRLYRSSVGGWVHLGDLDTGSLSSSESFPSDVVMSADASVVAVGARGADGGEECTGPDDGCGVDGPNSGAVLIFTPVE